MLACAADGVPAYALQLSIRRRRVKCLWCVKPRTAFSADIAWMCVRLLLFCIPIFLLNMFTVYKKS